jgi:two-component system phosphate regulon sensor histidine kinase PhoR
LKGLRGFSVTRTGVPLVLLLAFVVVIGYLDVATGQDIGMTLFYLIPISIAGYRLGRAAGVIVACAGATTWLVSDLLTTSYGPEVAVWNGFTRFVVFNGVALLLDHFRHSREDMERGVAELHAEHSRQTALMAALRDPILVADPDGVVTSANERAADLFGPAPVVGRRVVDLMPFTGTEIRPGRGRWLGRVTDPFGGNVELEVVRARLSGRGGERAALFVLHDITSHAELNRMREQLLYSVAHELRGPLGVLENALEILAEEYADLSAEEYGKLTGSARRTAHRLRTLMEDLLSAGTIQAGRFRIRPKPVALEEIVAEAVETVELPVAERGQRVDVSLPSDGLVVEVDRGYVRQVITNLLANASKYSPEKTAITLTAAREDALVRVTVADRGPGIPREQLAGLFERFYRIRHYSDEPGVGLGLAIAKGIVEAHGGTIGIESEVGKGTKVWFTLPAAREMAATSRSSSSMTTAS